MRGGEWHLADSLMIGCGGWQDVVADLQIGSHLAAAAGARSPTTTMRRLVNDFCSGSFSQPAACSVGTTYFLKVSASFIDPCLTSTPTRWVSPLPCTATQHVSGGAGDGITIAPAP